MGVASSAASGCRPDERPGGTPMNPEPGDRPADLRLSRVHLRLGSLELARAELEAAAGAGGLDGPALLDLAEVRWRTGDVAGAGVAASAYRATGGDALLALVVETEAAAAAGHLSEARRLAAEAVGRAGVSLDGVFAGLPRSTVWPLDPGERPVPVGTLFGAVGSGGVGGPGGAEGDVGGTEVVDDEPVPPADDGAGPGLWEPLAAADSAAVADAPADDADDSASGSSDGLADARSALEQGDDAGAAAALADLLRRRPDLAAAVLGALGEPGTAPDDAPGDAPDHAAETQDDAPDDTTGDAPGDAS
jgi:hypothetical protein